MHMRGNNAFKSVPVQTSSSKDVISAELREYQQLQIQNSNNFCKHKQVLKENFEKKPITKITSQPLQARTSALCSGRQPRHNNNASPTGLRLPPSVYKNSTIRTEISHDHQNGQ